MFCTIDYIVARSRSNSCASSWQVLPPWCSSIIFVRSASPTGRTCRFCKSNKTTTTCSSPIVGGSARPLFYSAKARILRISWSVHLFRTLPGFRSVIRGSSIRCGTSKIVLISGRGKPRPHSSRSLLLLDWLTVSAFAQIFVSSTSFFVVASTGMFGLVIPYSKGL